MHVTSSLLTGSPFLAFGLPTLSAVAAPVAPAASPPAVVQSDAETKIKSWRYSHVKRSIIHLVDRMSAGEDRGDLSHQSRQDFDKILSIYEADPTLWDEISKNAVKSDPLVKPTAAGAFLYLAFDVNKTSAVEFWRQLTTGAMIPKPTSPSLRLRDKLIGDDAREIKPSRVDQLRELLIAFRAHLGKSTSINLDEVPTTSILTA